MLPFGLRSTPKISAYADTLALMLANAGVTWQLHYLDDFLFFGHPGSQGCERALHLAIGSWGCPLQLTKLWAQPPLERFWAFRLRSHVPQSRPSKHSVVAKPPVCNQVAAAIVDQPPQPRSICGCFSLTIQRTEAHFCKINAFYLPFC